MEFRLIYQGPLHADGPVTEKHHIRREFHRQLATLWTQRPLNNVVSQVTAPAAGGYSLIPLEKYQFLPLVTSALHLVCNLDILLLRRGEPGRLIQHGGDIDNRLKTLFDALRVPKNAAELPSGDPGPQSDETPYFYCLLEDDARVTSFSVVSDRLLVPAGEADQNHVVLVLHVTTKLTQLTWDSLVL